MGLTSNPPNREAIDFLLEVFPRVNLRHPEVYLVIIGGPVRRRAPWLITPGNIPYEEVPVFLKAASVAVAPIFSGSGTRLKILEYMAAGLPVVATAKGAEGLNIQNGENIVLAENVASFAEQLAFLLVERIAAERIGRAGQQLVRRYYDWSEIAPRFTADHLAAIFPRIMERNSPDHTDYMDHSVGVRG
jgi:glycosyltransferase involved in cell wall biosynthesis